MNRYITRFCLAAAGALCLAAAPARADDMADGAADGVIDRAAVGSSLGTAAAVAAELVLESLALLGVPYRYGGDDPRRGMDCSGLVRHVFRSVLGLELPRNAEAMARHGASVAFDALQVGDLVFFNTRGRRYSHVGIYIGDGRFVHAPARRGQVRIEDIGVRYWQQRFNGGRRLADATAAGASEPAVSVPPASAAPGQSPAECASCER